MIAAVVGGPILQTPNVEAGDSSILLNRLSSVVFGLVWALKKMTGVHFVAIQSIVILFSGMTALFAAQIGAVVRPLLRHSSRLQGEGFREMRHPAGKTRGQFRGDEWIAPFPRYGTTWLRLRSGHREQGLGGASPRRGMPVMTAPTNLVCACLGVPAGRWA
jgi:hypothetical protein